MGISALRVELAIKASEIEEAKREARVASDEVSTLRAATKQAQVSAATAEKRLEEAQNHWQTVAENERKLRIDEEQHRRDAQNSVEKYQKEAQQLQTRERERRIFAMARETEVT